MLNLNFHQVFGYSLGNMWFFSLVLASVFCMCMCVRVCLCTVHFSFQIHFYIHFLHTVSVHMGKRSSLFKRLIERNVNTSHLSVISPMFNSMFCINASRNH